MTAYPHLHKGPEPEGAPLLSRQHPDSFGFRVEGPRGRVLGALQSRADHSVRNSPAAQLQRRVSGPVMQLGKRKTVDQTRKDFYKSVYKIKKKKAKGKAKGSTKVRARHAGDAEFLAKQRFIRKLKVGNTYKVGKGMKIFDPGKVTFPQALNMVKSLTGVSYKEWKGNTNKGNLREAQHIIPASVAMKFGIGDDFINSAENGMMLQAGMRSQKKQTSYSPSYLKYKAKKKSDFKKKVMHVGKRNRLAHPNYNKGVEALLNKAKDKNGVVSKAKALKIAMDLRKKHYGKDKKTQFSDDLF